MKHMKKQKPTNTPGSKKPLDVKVKIAMGVGIGLVVAGVGYLGYLGWYHSQTDVARSVSYDEFPEELISTETSESESTQTVYTQDEILTTNATFGEVLNYAIEDPTNDITVTGVTKGTDYSSIIGIDGDAIVVTYTAVIGDEAGWNSEPVIFTATMSDGAARMLTYVNMDGTWVDPSTGLAEMEYGETYEFIAYCECSDGTDSADIYSYASDMYCQELSVTAE
jgi:hypothetical protein